MSEEMNTGLIQDIHELDPAVIAMMAEGEDVPEWKLADADGTDSEDTDGTDGGDDDGTDDGDEDDGDGEDGDAADEDDGDGDDDGSDAGA
jgi:hypothetical protein